MNSIKEAFFDALYEGDVALVRECLNRQRNLVHASDDSPGLRLPLALASFDGNAPVVRLLLEYGAPVNQQTRFGDTPLFMAVNQNNHQVVQVLLEYNADVHLGRRSLLAVAVDKNCPEILESLLRREENPARVIHEKRLLCEAVMKKYPNAERIVQILVDNGAEIGRAEKSSGATPLMWATTAVSNTRIAEILLNSQRANINARNSAGDTALLLSIYSVKTCPELVPLLLRHGAHVNARNNAGETPLLRAVKFNADTNVLQSLLNGGADARVATIEQGDTPLITAVRKENLQAVQLLLSHDAVPANVPNKAKQTPLFLAVQEKNVPIVHALVNHGAIVWAASRTPAGDMSSPLLYSCVSGCSDISYLLLRSSPSTWDRIVNNALGN